MYEAVDILAGWPNTAKIAIFMHLHVKSMEIRGPTKAVQLFRIFDIDTSSNFIR
jgi:hypothetical protein